MQTWNETTLTPQIKVREQLFRLLISAYYLNFTIHF